MACRLVKVASPFSVCVGIICSFQVSYTRLVGQQVLTKPWCPAVAARGHGDRRCWHLRTVDKVSHTRTLRPKMLKFLHAAADRSRGCPASWSWSHAPDIQGQDMVAWLPGISLRGFKTAPSLVPGELGCVWEPAF